MRRGRTNRPSRRWRRYGLVLALLAGAYVGTGWVAATGLTRRPRPPFPEPAPPGFEPVRLESSDGLAIGAWWAEPEQPRAVVVLVHGNGASRGHLLDEARALRSAGCAVLPISVRAHGDSEGELNDIGWSARHDVVAALRYAHTKHPELHVGVYGMSLGAAAALFAAEEPGGAADRYVLVGPYADLRLAVRRRTKKYLGLLELPAYGALLLGGRIALPELDRIRPVRAASSVPIGTPALVIAGGDDDRAPWDDTRRIAHAMSRGATPVEVPGLDHEDLGQLVDTSVWARVVELLCPPMASTEPD